MDRQKHFLLFITNPWHYENKQSTIKKTYKNATRTAKIFFIFFKKCWFLGPILKNLCLRKMGVAGIKWWPCLSTIPSFLININEEAFLKVSFKNIDWFQIWKNYFFQKGPKNKQILKNLKFFFAFLFAFLMDFSMVYCLFSYSQWFFLHFNFTAISSQLATTVDVKTDTY